VNYFAVFPSTKVLGRHSLSDVLH